MEEFTTMYWQKQSLKVLEFGFHKTLATLIGRCAILLRFMDSFMIYTEPFVLTGGGPGNTTAFLSIDLVKMALGQFDLGPAAAMSLIYFFIVLLVCWVFYNLMMKNEAQS